MRTFQAKKEFALSFVTTIALAGIPLTQAKPTNPVGFAPVASQEVASSSIGEKDLEQEIHIEKPDISHNPADCDIFDDPNSVACLGPAKGYEPTNNVERLVQKGATYSTRFVPMMNRGAKGSDYADAIKSDGKAFLIGGINNSSNGYVNEQIQKIPFFAQTSVSFDAVSQGNSKFSVDSLMKLKEIDVDDEGDLKTLVFSQAKATLPVGGGIKGDTTTNLGLGIRHRPNEESMVGGNVFWDYRMTTYDVNHSRLGLGGEYLWKDFELRNNWYMAMTGKKDITLGGSDYTERVVPGWDVEVGYRLPDYPELGVFVKAFNWDYHKTQDNSGLEGSLNWQATPHANVEVWASNEIAAYQTVENNNLPDLDDVFFGLRMKLTGRPVNFKKNIKKNLVTQMTQPVKRRYDVLLERYARGGSFTNRAAGS